MCAALEFSVVLVVSVLFAEVGKKSGASQQCVEKRWWGWETRPVEESLKGGRRDGAFAN